MNQKMIVACLFQRVLMVLGMVHSHKILMEVVEVNYLLILGLVFVHDNLVTLVDEFLILDHQELE